MKIVGVTMVRNERTGLEKCLPSILKLCDSVYGLVDGSSTDGSGEVISQFGGQWSVADWVDFGTNRGLSFSRAATIFSDADWFLTFDGHEELLGDCSRLRDFLSDLSWDTDGVFLPVELGLGLVHYGVPKILRPSIQWKGPVHNYPVVVERKLAQFDQVRIVHHSEWRTSEQVEFRKEQYRTESIDKMKECASRGESRYVYHVAMALYDVGRYEECLEWADKYQGSWSSERFAHTAYVMRSAIELGKFEVAFAIAEREVFHRHDYYFLRAWALFGLGRLDEAGLCYGLALSIPVPPVLSHCPINVTRSLCEENLRRLARVKYNQG